MRQDLVKLIETQEDATNAIVLTHNIDFVFLQMIVLSALRHCGRPTLTVFADAHCAAEAFAYQSPVLSTLGTRYRVVPVAMEPGFRFHPKALLLSGPTKATLWIGSGNLTFGGWKENAEAWVHFESDRDTTGPFAAFRAYLHEILRRVPIPGPVQDEVDEAFDGQTHPWAKEMDEPSGLLGRAGSGVSLLQRMAMEFGNEPIQRMVICSPYYDPDAEALDKLRGQFQPATVQILIQKKYPGFPRAAASRLPANVEMVSIGFTRIGAKGVERESFIHAKFYGLSSGNRTLVFVGSANCSRAALLFSGKGGNAELLALQPLNSGEFQELYLAEIPRVEGTLELPEMAKEDQTPTNQDPIRILAARYEGGELHIAFASDEDVRVTHCWANGICIPFEVQEDGVGIAEVAEPPARLVLEGVRNGETVRSREGWVDVEQELRSTSRGRTFASVVREAVQANRWGLGAWKEVMDVFCKYLQYMPLRSSGWGRGKGIRRSRNLAEFTVEDVFSSAYGLPNFGSAIRAGLVEDRIHSLQQMLLRWFGIPANDDTDTENVEQPVDDGNEEDEDVVDRPEPILPRKHPIPPPKPINEADMRMAKKSVEQMKKVMTSENFVAGRSPEFLAADLKIAAVLLRTGLAEGWITKADFFETTRKIWSWLFFSSPGTPSQGWLERRYREAEDPEEFVAKMASPELSAALAAWSMAARPEGDSPEYASHALAQVLAVARLPWLWRGGERGRISDELEHLLANTVGELSDEDLKHNEESWVRLIRRGEALRALEEVLGGHSPAEIRSRIQENHVSRGELLWQGNSGYCVALRPCQRSSQDKVPVLCLQGMRNKTDFLSAFLIPLRSLLVSGVLPETERLVYASRQIIHEMIDEISKAFSST